MSIISDQNVIALGAILFGLAWLGFWIDTKPIGKKTSGVIWVLLGAGLIFGGNYYAVWRESRRKGH